jgi:hypothetical protein
LRTENVASNVKSSLPVARTAPRKVDVTQTWMPAGNRQIALIREDRQNEVSPEPVSG